MTSEIDKRESYNAKVYDYSIYLISKMYMVRSRQLRGWTSGDEL